MTSRDEVLVSKIKTKLAKSGFLQNAKARLSSEILMELKGITNIPIKQPRNLKDQAIRCLILDYLKKENLEYSISTFQSEICSHSEIAIEEILKLFGISEHLNLMQSSHDDQSSLLYCLMTSIGKCFEGPQHKDIHLQTTSTQTSPLCNDLITTRNSLRENLNYIEEKHKDLSRTSSLRKSSLLLDQQLFQFQKECESRERILMEKKLEDFKRDIVSRIQQDESAKYNKEMNKVKSQWNQDHERAMKILQEQSTVQKMNMEEKHLVEVKRLTKEIDTLKRNERENRNFLEVERRKLQLDEQRCKQMIKTAETKLKMIETKEEELRETVRAEYKKCQDEAKQNYEEALKTVKKQGKLYSDGLEELNSLRRVSTEHLMKSEIASTETSELRVQNKSLLHEIDKMNAEMKELQLSCNINTQSSKDDIKSLTSSNLRLQQALDEAHQELSFIKTTEKESSRYLKEKFSEQEQKLKEALATLERVKVERNAVISENQELRQLLESTQNTLLSLRSTEPFKHKVSATAKAQRQTHDIDQSTNSSIRKKDSMQRLRLVEDRLSQLEKFSVIKNDGGSHGDMNQNSSFDLDIENREQISSCIAVAQTATAQTDTDTKRGYHRNEHDTFSGNEINERSHQQNPADVSHSTSKDEMKMNSIKDQSICTSQEILKNHSAESTNHNAPVIKILETHAELRLSPLGIDKHSDGQIIRKDSENDDCYHSDFDSESFVL